MASSYHKLLKKITDTEKRLKPGRQEISALMDLEFEEMESCNKENIVEEYKNLRENMNGAVMDSYSLAYQPAKIKTKKWAQQNF